MTGPVCWFCYWGWHPEVQAIYDEAIERLSDRTAMQGGPGRQVWEHENFNHTQWCLEHFDENRQDYSEGDLAIVRNSLVRLLAIPEEFTAVPAGYDFEHPENYPPSWAVSKGIMTHTARHRWIRLASSVGVWTVIAIVVGWLLVVINRGLAIIGGI